MDILFLDFDGPIFPEKIHLYPQNNGDVCSQVCKELNLHPFVAYWYADPFAIAILNELKKETNYKLVISSSWADLHEKEELVNLLNKNGLNYDLHDDWKTPRNKGETRQEQINNWLLNHPEIEHYFIFDDTKSAPELFVRDPYDFNLNDTFKNTKIKIRYVFLAHENDGFTYEQFNEMKFLISLFKEKTNKPKI